MLNKVQKKSHEYSILWRPAPKRHNDIGHKCMLLWWQSDDMVGFNFDLFIGWNWQHWDIAFAHPFMPFTFSFKNHSVLSVSLENHPCSGRLQSQNFSCFLDGQPFIEDVMDDLQSSFVVDKTILGLLLLTHLLKLQV